MVTTKSRWIESLLLLAALGFSLPAVCSVLAQDAGSLHSAEIYGVRIGMDVPTALEAVFVNAKRQPGQEKPDALHTEGGDKRVLYKLKEGNLQIVFAEGKWVREIQMAFANPLLQDDLKLLDTSNIFGNTGGETRHDDRYSVGFTSDDKKERYWWRDENTDASYRVRIGFVSDKLIKGGRSGKEIVRKIVSVVPEDKDKFKKAVAHS